MGLRVLRRILRSDTEEELQMTFSRLMIRDGCGWDSGRDVKTHTTCLELSPYRETSTQERRRRYSRNGKITSVFLFQSLADADLGDLLHQQESKIVNTTPRKQPVITQSEGYQQM